MHPLSVSPANGGGDIFDCIQRGNIEQCAHLVQLDRSILKLKGWGGFTPLHCAALHGNRALVDLLLSNGADPNLTCDSAQTAFHFACRQGNIYIIHQMMQHGADLRIIDLQGKTSLHHAVTGGNIAAMHYLWETGMFRFSDTDMNHVSPLHLAASTGNTEVVHYLLRDQRCAVEAVDQQGATALHVAAERGGMEVCWTLLQKAGFRVLHQKNHSGLTPLDLSRQGKTFRHQQLTKLLSQYINEPVHLKPKESHVLYYWTLLFPSLGGAAILLIAAMVGGYGALTCSLLFPWLARSIFTQYHRMTTYQRLPNPIYLGTLIAGLFHTLLCFYGKIMPNILKLATYTVCVGVWPASVLVQISMGHFSLVLGLFCKVLTQDPGTLEQADADPRFSCIADLVESNQSPHRFCPFCELFQPDHSRHCRLCDMCVRDYDHHCLFLNCCIGRGNHRVFLLFVISMVTAHLLFVLTASNYLYTKMAATGLRSLSWVTVLGAEFWVVVMVIMNALTLLWEAWLLTEQFDAVAMGTTTYFRQCEISPRQRSLVQRWGAVVSFLVEGRQVGVGRKGQDTAAIDI